MDSLRNIVRDGRVSLMFLIHGSNTAIRVNGTARLSVDPVVLAGFARQAGQPRSVIVVAIAEVYSQCACALIRAGLWQGVDESAGLPREGDMLRRLRGKLDYTTVGFLLLPPQFTLHDVQLIHEAILDRPLNKPAFRRKFLV